MNGNYVSFIKTEKGLDIVPDMDAIGELDGDERAALLKLGDDEGFCELVENQLCNGWKMFTDQDKYNGGHLTDSILLTDDWTASEEDGNVTEYGDLYWMPDYAFRLLVDDLLDGKTLHFEKA